MWNVNDQGLSSGSFGACRWAGMGRPLPAVDVRYLVAQVDGQLPGGEIAGATGTSRPLCIVLNYA